MVLLSSLWKKHSFSSQIGLFANIAQVMFWVHNPVAVQRTRYHFVCFFFFLTDASFMSDADWRRSFLAPFIACMWYRRRKQGSLMVLRSVTKFGSYHDHGLDKETIISVQLFVKSPILVTFHPLLYLLWQGCFICCGKRIHVIFQAFFLQELLLIKQIRNSS